MTSRLVEVLRFHWRRIYNWRIWYKKNRYKTWNFKHEIEDKQGENRRIILALTPTFSNVGDMAIAVCERKFFQQNLCNFEIIEIPIDDVGHELIEKNFKVKDNDIIALQGGGNFGIEYMEAEYLRRGIIELYPNNRIVSFPQTIYYDSSFSGRIAYKQSKRIYNRHKKLYLFAREKISYDIMKSSYTSARVQLIPDIVLLVDLLSMNEIMTARKDQILLCLRNDVERKHSNADINIIETELAVFNKKIIHTDMCVSRNIDIDEQESVVRNKINEFSQASLVITDRIHGMIFGVITGTPTIVLGNYNHKVFGEYEMIKEDFPYILYADSFSDVKAKANFLLENAIELNNCDTRFKRDAYHRLIEVFYKDV